MNRPLDVAMGFITASWLAGAWLGKTGPYAFYALMSGAVLTVIIWAAIHIAILSAKGEGG